MFPCAGDIPRAAAPRDGYGGAPAAGSAATATEPEHDDFGSDGLAPHWSTLRRPADPTWHLTLRRSHLRVHGGRSPRSLTGASLVARRVTAPHCSLEASVEFRPQPFQHVAGITAYYNTRNWYHLHLTTDDHGQTVLRHAACDRGVTSVDVTAPVVPDNRARLDLDGAELRLRYDTGYGWRFLGPVLDARVLSDEHPEEMEPGVSALSDSLARSSGCGPGT